MGEAPILTGPGKLSYMFGPKIADLRLKMIQMFSLKLRIWGQNFAKIGRCSAPDCGFVVLCQSLMSLPIITFDEYQEVDGSERT